MRTGSRDPIQAVVNHQSSILNLQSLNPYRGGGSRSGRLRRPDGRVEGESVETGAVRRESEGKLQVRQDAQLVPGLSPRNAERGVSLGDIGEPWRGVGVARARRRLL